MAELDLRPQIKQEKREYSVQEIFRLAEKFRHLAQNLNEVFIQASRQGLIYQIQTDPEEEELKEELGMVAGLSKRLKSRIQRREFKKLTLVKAEVAKPVEKKAVVAKAAIVTPQKQEVKATPVKEEEKPKPQPQIQAAASLLDAARGFNILIDDAPAVIAGAAPESIEEVSSGINPLQLSSEELPKYKKYADIAQQLLEARQIPHFKTLVEKAKGELSPLGIQLLEELARKAGF
jgi:hypothetical protein